MSNTPRIKDADSKDTDRMETQMKQVAHRAAAQPFGPACPAHVPLAVCAADLGISRVALVTREGEGGGRKSKRKSKKSKKSKKSSKARRRR